MKFTLPKKVLLGAGALVLSGLALFFVNRPSTSDWTNVGVGGPASPTDYPYRLIGLKDLPATHPDMNALILALQDGRSRGAWVYFPVSHCYAPDVLDGVPTVLCKTRNESDVYVAGKDNVREILMSLRSSGKVAAIKGKVLGLHGSTPVVWVNDPASRLYSE